MSLFKKKGGQISAANVHMTEAEAALAQSDFNIEKITDIQNKFAGGAVLLVPGRIFIREGLLYKVCRKGLKKRQFFLFNDILVYGSIVAGLYSNQQILPLSQMSVSADCFYQPRVEADFIAETDEANLSVANAFQISHANKSFHVFGQSAADKANWMANLQKHISRVAKTLEDSQQQALTRAVWVPDSMSKECMICSTKFTAFQRKHHCRRCGRVVCSSCSPHRVSLVTGEGGVVTGSGDGNGRLERTCRECFKEMTAVHNRANSVGSNSITRVSTKSTPSRPPPPTVAAQIVSNALRVVTTKGEGESPQEIDTSTDTEDSDDSGNEEEVQAPIPIKRNSTSNIEEVRPVPVARQSIKNSNTSPNATPPIPAVRRSIKTSSDEASPPLIQKSSNLTPENESEPQPTPPPRKKKQMKQKMKEQQQQESTAEEDKTDGLSESPSNKKARRRNKFKPSEEDTKVATTEVLSDGVEAPTDAVEGEAGDNVEGEAGNGVEGEAGDNVEGEASDSVEGGAGDSVESGTGDSKNNKLNDDAIVEQTDAEATPITEGEKVECKMESKENDTETKEVASEAVKQQSSGDNSPSVETSTGKRTARRRNKFKTSTPQT